MSEFRRLINHKISHYLDISDSPLLDIVHLKILSEYSFSIFIKNGILHLDLWRLYGLLSKSRIFDQSAERSLAGGESFSGWRSQYR